MEWKLSSRPSDNTFSADGTVRNGLIKAENEKFVVEIDTQTREFIAKRNEEGHPELYGSLEPNLSFSGAMKFIEKNINRFF